MLPHVSARRKANVLALAAPGKKMFGVTAKVIHGFVMTSCIIAANMIAIENPLQIGIRRTMWYDSENQFENTPRPDLKLESMCETALDRFDYEKKTHQPDVEN